MEYPEILYEDNDLVGINKPAGWVVHEGAGETGETIGDWFVKNYPEVMQYQWEDLSRVGIVHRLDKDTSGVMVLAKSPEVLIELQSQFKARTTKKIYIAFLFGAPKEKEGVIQTFIGRHPKRRQEQAVLPIQIGEQTRREALTEYQVEQVGELHGEIASMLTFFPKTGRMHQLRVHAKYLGTPILGDQLYNTKPSKRFSKKWHIERQLLHAASLEFIHPISHKNLTIRTKLPDDMQEILAQLT